MAGGDSWGMRACGRLRRAHLPMELEQRPVGDGKMKRNTVPLAFGRGAEKAPKVERDRDQLEKQRRWAVTESRPLVFPKAQGKGGGGDRTTGAYPGEGRSLTDPKDKVVHIIAVARLVRQALTQCDLWRRAVLLLSAHRGPQWRAGGGLGFLPAPWSP